MNLPEIIETRKRLDAVLTECSIILGAYKNIIMADKATTAKLGDEALKHVGILNRHIKRLERDIAEMERQELAIRQSTPVSSLSPGTSEQTKTDKPKGS